MEPSIQCLKYLEQAALNVSPDMNSKLAAKNWYLIYHPSIHEIFGLRSVEYVLYIKPMINCKRDDENSLIKVLWREIKKYLKISHVKPIYK